MLAESRFAGGVGWGQIHDVRGKRFPPSALQFLSDAIIPFTAPRGVPYVYKTESQKVPSQRRCHSGGGRTASAERALAGRRRGRKNRCGRCNQKSDSGCRGQGEMEG